MTFVATAFPFTLSSGAIRQLVKAETLAKKSGGRALTWKTKEVGRGFVPARARARWEKGVRSALGPKEGGGGIAERFVSCFGGLGGLGEGYRWSFNALLAWGCW